MSDACLFCEIVAKRVPATILREDDHTLAFPDIAPVAPFHALVIPKRHLAAWRDVDDAQLASALFRACAAIAKDAGHDDGGYRIVANTGPGAGQSVRHLHLHVLGGRRFAWPPG